MNRLFFVLLFFVLGALPDRGYADSFLFGQNEPQLVVNNRILAKVNGKAISVIDVMKKMDMMFYRQFPEYTSSVQARYQYYQVNWKQVLYDLVDKELVMADGTEVKMTVNGGDVRQEMEELFGPNIITNLDKVGLTFDEAHKMIHADILIRRMMFLRVHAKAMRQVTPQVIRDHYEEFSKNNIRDTEWQYQVISIRDKDPKKADEIADLTYKLLADEGVALSDLSKKLKEMGKEIDSLNISEEYKHKDKEVSEAYKDILVKLNEGHFSRPLAQKSRASNATVFRIFALQKMVPGGVVPFNEIENQLKEKLIDEAIEKETEAYITRLRQHFDVQQSHFNDMISEGFVPFALK